MVWGEDADLVFSGLLIHWCASWYEELFYSLPFWCVCPHKCYSGRAGFIDGGYSFWREAFLWCGS